jgi:hypothetical protein
LWGKFKELEVSKVAMPEKFDPYHEWLGIPAAEQPANIYRLLGIPVLEASPSVIENAANQRMAHLRTFQTGKHVAESQRLLNEVAAARVCLLNTEKKAAYDEELRKRLAAKKSVVAPPLAEPGLDEVFATPLATGTIRGRKKPPRSRMPVIIAAAATTAAIVVAGIVLILSRGGKSDEQAAAGNATRAADSASRPRGTANTAAAISKPKPSAKASASTTTAAAPKPSETAHADSKWESPDAGAADNNASTTGGTSTAAAPNDKPTTDPPASDEKPPAKITPPSPEEQKKIIAEIDEVYKTSGAGDPAAQAALARKLLDDGQKNSGNRAEQFVLFRRAGELARDAGDVDLTIEAVESIVAAGFDIRLFQVKARLLKRLLEQGVAGGQVSAVSAATVKFAEEAAAQDAGDEAIEVLEAARKAFAESVRRAQTASLAARAAAAHARVPSEKADLAKKATEGQAEVDAVKLAQSTVADCIKSVQGTLRDRRAVQAIEEKLKASPDDPDACLAMGRWKCFHEGNWDEGLKFLAKGSDLSLKSLAADELASKSSTPLERVARGDVWWDAAEKAERGDKSALRGRAQHWYSQALPDLTGLMQAKVEKRLQAMQNNPAPESAAGPGAAARGAASRGTLVKTIRVGHDSGGAFEDGNASTLLLGFGASVRHIRGRDAISSIQAIYRSGGKQEAGPVHGGPNGTPTIILARPGYAVGGIFAHGGDRLDGFRVVFMRIKGRGLDTSQSYQSDWVGGEEQNIPVHLGCDGNLVVGIYGGSGACVDGMGLIQLEPASAGGKSRRAAVRIIVAQWGGGQVWTDVATRVQELFDSGDNFWVKVGTLKADPTPHWRKHLKVVYRKDDQQKEFWVDEDGKVDVQAIKNSP